MVTLNSTTQKSDKQNEQNGTSRNQIKQVIGVISAKGGVGKSFVTGLLACELNKKNYRVGILDADITGSSMPMLFGLQGPVNAGQNSFAPLESQSGIKIISMNLLFKNEDQSVIWQESMVAEVINELFSEVEWGPLDYLLIDMPPATSETAVEILQSLPFKGVIIVTTPQMLVNKIVNKAISVVQRIGIPVLGIVENMAYYLSYAGGEKQYIFGQCRGASLAIMAKSPLLAQIPLDSTSSKLCDSGKIEEVAMEESTEMVDTLLESLSDFNEKKAATLTESKNAGLKSAYFGGQWEVEEDQWSNYRSPSLVAPLRKSFSEIALALIRSKENVGVLENPDAQGHFLGSCGDRMQVDLQIEAGKISEARFMADGCGATLACGSMITKIARGMTLNQATQITAESLLTALGGLPEDHEHCAELAVMTLRDAVIDAVEGHRSLTR